MKVLGILYMVVGLTLLACNKSEADSEADTDSAKETGTDSSDTDTDEDSDGSDVSTGTLAIAGCDDAEDCGVKLAAELSSSSVAVTAVQANMEPGAIALDDGMSLLDDDDVPNISGCFSEHGVAPCQPVAQQFYIWLAKKPLASVGEILEGVSGLFGDLTAATGTIALDDGDLDYAIKSVSEYDILIKLAGERIHFRKDSDGKMEVTGWSRKTEGDSAGQFRAIITYTSEKIWQSDVTTFSSDCSEQPPIRVIVHRDDTNWRGKSMIQLPADSENCSDNVPDGDSGYYSDFIGTNDYMTGSMYWVPMTVDLSDDSAVEDIEDYSYVNLCANLPDQEQCVYYDDDFLSNYANPYCVAAGIETLEVSDYGAACSGNSLGTDQYLGRGLWVTPASLREIAGAVYCLPKTLGEEGCWEPPE